MGVGSSDGKKKKGPNLAWASLWKKKKKWSWYNLYIGHNTIIHSRVVRYQRCVTAHHVSLRAMYLQSKPIHVSIRWSQKTTEHDVVYKVRALKRSGSRSQFSPRTPVCGACETKRRRSFPKPNHMALVPKLNQSNLVRLDETGRGRDEAFYDFGWERMIVSIATVSYRLWLLARNVHFSRQLVLLKMSMWFWMSYLRNRSLKVWFHFTFTSAL